MEVSLSGWVARFAMVATLLCTVARAGEVTIELPRTESAAAWRPALELAGLQLAPQATDATVAIVELGDHWRLSVAAGEAHRTVDVPAPTDARAREEVAFLARALGRSIAPPDEPEGRLHASRAPAPTASLTLPPPPTPEATVAPVAPAGAVLAGLAPAPQAPPAPPPEAGIALVSAAALRRVSLSAPQPVLADVAPVAQPIVLEDLDPVARRRSTVATPGLALTTGFRLRPRVQAAFATTLLIDALTAGKATGTLELGVAPLRGVDVLDRGFWDLDLALVGGFALRPELRVAGLAGVAFRSFRQQATPIDEALVPFLGAAGEASWGGRFRAGVRLRATVDLVQIALVDEQGRADNLLPIEIGAALVLRMSPRGDPSAALRTPTRR